MRGSKPLNPKNTIGLWYGGTALPRALMAAIADPDRAAAQRAFESMMQMTKIDIAAIEAARRG